MSKGLVVLGVDLFLGSIATREEVGHHLEVVEGPLDIVESFGPDLFLLNIFEESFCFLGVVPEVGGEALLFFFFYFDTFLIDVKDTSSGHRLFAL